MADIFISYAHEDKERVRLLVDALTSQGWSVFWDSRIPAGGNWRDYISKISSQSCCMVVVWSRHSVASEWVIEEADIGKSQRILVPVLFDDVPPPLGFRTIQAANLIDWNGKPNTSTFLMFAQDVGRICKHHVPKSTEQTVSKVALADHPSSEYSASGTRRFNLKRLENWKLRVVALIVGLTAVAIIYLLFPRNSEDPVFADVFAHETGFTHTDAIALQRTLEGYGIPTSISTHRDPTAPDAIFIGLNVSARKARIAINAIPYDIKYLFRPDYPATYGGDPTGWKIGIGYISSHGQDSNDPRTKPVRIATQQLSFLTDPKLSDAEFQRRLREITQY